MREVNLALTTLTLASTTRIVVDHVRRKHTGLEQTRFFAAQLHRGVLVAHGPLLVGLECITPVEVGTHARDDSHFRFFAAAAHSPKKSRPLRNFPWRWTSPLRDRGEDAGNADKDDVSLGGSSNRPTFRCSLWQDRVLSCCSVRHGESCAARARLDGSIGSQAWR